MNSGEYFEKLSLIRLLDAEESQRALISKLNRLYKRAAQEIENQIQEIFEAYSKYTGLSADKAREYLSKAEQDETLSKLKELLAATDDPQEQGDIIARINAKSYRYRITRLEATKDNAYVAIKKVGQVEKQEGEKLLQSAYGATYYQTIHDLGKALNIGISFSIVSPQQIRQAVQRPWIGKTFSERVWENTSKLASKAEEVITSAVMSGASVARAAEQLQKYSKQGIYGATRLVRTEMNHICNQAELDVYKDLGIDKYKYLATLDYRTCEVCQPLDNRTFKTEQAMTGSNYPPMHPNCRCTTTIDTNFSSRWANDGDKKYKADGDITYAQWRENMTDEQREAFDTYVKQWRNRASDEKQYKRYVERLGSANMPKTFDKFQELKYTQYEKWQGYKDAYRTAGEYAECVRDLRNVGVKGLIHIPGQKIDVSELSFDNEHINKQRAHNVTEQEAKSFIKEAAMSVTKRDGLTQNYYGKNGATYVNPIEKAIKTAYSSKEFHMDVKNIMGVLKKYDK